MICKQLDMFIEFLLTKHSIVEYMFYTTCQLLKIDLSFIYMFSIIECMCVCKFFMN